MPFEWTDFISCAEELSNKSDEASLRSSISRAYYGAFGKIKIYCSSKFDIRTIGDSLHQRVIQSLKESGDSDEFSLGNTLSQLRTSRNDADYDSHKTISKPQVTSVLNKSKLAIESLADLIKKDYK
jgi:uncharacterized protein (UPF0332 family)